MKKQYMKPEMAEVIINTMPLLAGSGEESFSVNGDVVTDSDVYADSREYDFDD
ncbi:MAG: hypothetical protein IJ527_06075 [Prevotella sp.]|nr:hypothetical protein [Prevotella sp.]